MTATNRPDTAWRSGWIVLSMLMLAASASCAQAGQAAGPTSPPVAIAGEDDAVVPDDSAVIDRQLGLAFDRLSRQGLPELSPDRREALLAAARSGLSPFAVSPALFQSSHRMLALFALAHRRLGDADPEADAFLRHACYLLGGDDLETIGDWPDRHRNREITPARVAAAYADNSDVELTGRLRAIVDERQWLVPARQRLQLAAAQEQPYQTRVLDFAVGDDRANAFARTLAMDQAWLPPLWLHAIDGQQFLAFTRPYAEQVLAIDRQSPDEQARTIALFVHEYVHSQGGMEAGRLGMLLEERRAEQFSGNRHGYYEVKQFFIYLRVVTGFDLLPVLEAHPRDPFAVYLAIAQAIGLDALAEVISAFPQPYLDRPNESMAVLAGHLGSRDGILRRLLQREVDAGREAAMNERFGKRIDDLAAILGRDRVQDDCRNNLALAYGLPTMAEKIISLLPTSP